VKKFIKWWLPVIVWMSAIFIGSSIGSVPRVGDKTTDGLMHRAAHVLEFAVLGALVLRALSKDQPATRREMILTLIVITLYGASDEFHQRFTPGRSAEGVSILFDAVGGAMGVWAYRWSQRRRALRGQEAALDQSLPPAKRPCGGGPCRALWRRVK
jgi:VanZ family protein